MRNPKDAQIEPTLESGKRAKVPATATIAMDKLTKRCVTGELNQPVEDDCPQPKQ